jgi:ATP-dependent Lon protease
MKSKDDLLNNINIANTEREGALLKTVGKRNIESILGKRKFKNDCVFKEPRTGVSYGLAWTETGGTVLPVETVAMPGKGELIITGNLGDVMKESARIALSYLHHNAKKIGCADFNFAKNDFHLHVPEGAIPQDGPSAGLALSVSILSVLLKKAPAQGIAMTGELTLTGRVLPIGGLKEKLLAAIRGGMTTVILPVENTDDWEELSKEISSKLEVHFVENADEAYKLLFTKEG